MKRSRSIAFEGFLVAGFLVSCEGGTVQNPPPGDTDPTEVDTDLHEAGPGDEGADVDLTMTDPGLSDLDAPLPDDPGLDDSMATDADVPEPDPDASDAPKPPHCTTAADCLDKVVLVAPCEEAVCLAGSCGKVSLPCDDGNPCTEDSCFPGLGCVHAETHGACDDLDPCTDPDFCSAGTCGGFHVPGCGPSVCGDGLCAGDETCGSCPSDCDPVRLGACEGSCDPMASPSGCAAGSACVPTREDGSLAADILAGGNGVCGKTCSADADCPGAVCLSFPDTGAGKFCAVPCDPSQSPGCAFGGGCTALPDGWPVKGACVRPCWVQNPSCAGLETGTACRGFAGASFHRGLCVKGTSVCHPVAGPACPAGQACRVLSGAGIAGAAWFCSDELGASLAGESCYRDADCGAGLACGQGACRPWCDPAAPLCASGVCHDLGVDRNLPAGTAGLCVPGCGDQVCGPGEQCNVCVPDCGKCPGACGDGHCVAGEGCGSCPEDCGTCPVCGDGLCADTETCTSCLVDCGFCANVCGDGLCEPLEFCGSCPADCGACGGVCGDGTCAINESCKTCPADCGKCIASCGDGVCGADETCDDCAPDCGLLGILPCGPQCDPTDAAAGCSPNHGCVPSLSGKPFLGVFNVGNGVCVQGCHTDTECEPGVCVLFEGLDQPGVCGPNCLPGVPGSCGAGMTCAPSADPNLGGCIPGTSCDSATPCAGPVPTSCVALAGRPGTGLCLPGCWVQTPGSCADPLRSCVGKKDPAWHSGRCVGQTSPCDPVAGVASGCPAGQTCMVVGHPAIGGHAKLCVQSPGSLSFDTSCSSNLACLPGLVCLQGRCTAYCKPGGTPCKSGACTDVSADHALPPKTLGVCR